MFFFSSHFLELIKDMPKTTASDEMQLGSTGGTSFQETMEKILLSSESIHGSYSGSLPILF